MTDANSSFWADQPYLRAVQYATDRNLAARQSIYGYAERRIDLQAAVVNALDLTGDEVVADVGCGNGLYLAELGRRGHQGGVLGLDASPGMLSAARQSAPSAALVVADAAGLPLGSASADIALAMHMLYHVPDPALALGELRRVTKPEGRVVIGLNNADHLRELRAVINEVLDQRGAGHRAHERITLGNGAQLAAAFFKTVTRHDFTGELLVPGPEPVADYVRSMTLTLKSADADQVVAAVIGRLDFGADGYFRVKTASGCLICR